MSNVFADGISNEIIYSIFGGNVNFYFLSEFLVQRDLKLKILLMLFKK